MEWFFPWGSFLKRSGGIITGNLTVQGQFQCDGIATHNDIIIIVKDVTNIGDPHIALRPATGAGLYDLIECQNIPGAFESGVGSDISTNLFLLPGLGGQVVMPVDIIDPDPPWKIPLLVQGLGVRRMLMLHSLMFG